MFIKAEKKIYKIYHPFMPKILRKKNRNIQDIPQFDKGCQ